MDTSGTDAGKRLKFLTVFKIVGTLQYFAMWGYSFVQGVGNPTLIDVLIVLLSTVWFFISFAMWIFLI